MSVPTRTEQLELKLKTLIFKRDYLFTKAQKLYECSKSVRDDPNKIQTFLAQFSELDSVRTKFENTIMEILEIDMELKPGVKLTTSQLDAFESLYDSCSLVARKCQAIQLGGGSQKNKPTELTKPSLPKLTLFEFDGELENWTTFYDTFHSLVHSRDFTDIDKFHYLISCVKGDALKLVKQLPITAANYKLVWQSLLEKYQDNRALAGRYLDKMLNFPTLNKDTCANLNLFIQTFDHSLKAIKALNIENLDDYFICHLVLRGLDPHTKKLFEESRDQKTIPKFSELVEFVNKQIKVLEHLFPSTSTTQPKTKPGFIKGNQISNSRTSSKSVLTASRVNKSEEYKNRLVCPHCQQGHMIYRCEAFRKLPVEGRLDRVKALRLCTNCLKNHDKASCTSPITCGVCTAPHHFLLHKDQGRATSVGTSAVPSHSPAQPRSSYEQQALVSSSNSVSGSAPTQNALCSFNEYGVVLGTTRTHILDISGQYQDCRGVIDSGAQTSFITAECAQRLGLPRKKCPFSISGLGGEFIKNQGMVTCTIKPRHQDGPMFTLNMVVVTKVAGEMPNVGFSREVIKQYDGFNLADPEFYKKARVDILLGNDIVSQIITNKPLFINDDIPSVLDTVFGSVVSGKLTTDKKDQRQGTIHNYFLSVSEGESLDQALRAFWTIEEVPCTPSINPLDQLAEDIFVKEHTRESNGRYVVPLPRVPDHPPLGDSRTAAERRLLYTERKLARSPVLQQAYTEFMRDYEVLDHMEERLLVNT